MNSIRKTKEEDEELKARLREKYIYDNPDASKEKIVSNVFKLVALHKLKEKQDEFAISHTKDETFKPDLSKTLRSKKVKEYHHDGVWMESTNAGAYCWSCCMCEDFKAPGCVAKVRDLHRWQVLSM